AQLERRLALVAPGLHVQRERVADVRLAVAQEGEAAVVELERQVAARPEHARLQRRQLRSRAGAERRDVSAVGRGVVVERERLAEVEAPERLRTAPEMLGDALVDGGEQVRVAMRPERL